MINIFISLLKYTLKALVRHVYWVYKLSTSNLGKGIRIEFPVIREGKGLLTIGSNSFLGKNSKLGIGENAQLACGNNSYIDTRSVILVNKDCSLKAGNNFKLGEASRCYVQNHWHFGDNVSIETNCSIFSREPGLAGRFVLHNNSHVGDNCIIDVSDDILIHENVAIGPNCTFYTHDHEYDDLNKAAWEGKKYTATIIIGKDSWIGSNVTILPGVTIGNHVVVAAGSVVTKNLDDNSIYAGVPAKKIKTIA